MSTEKKYPKQLYVMDHSEGVFVAFVTDGLTPHPWKDARKVRYVRGDELDSVSNILVDIMAKCNDLNIRIKLGKAVEIIEDTYQ